MCVYFLEVAHLLAATYSLTREKPYRALTQEQAIFNANIKHCFLLLGHQWNFGYPLACPVWGYSWISSYRAESGYCLLSCELCTSRSQSLWQRAGAYRTDPSALFLGCVEPAGQSKMIHHTCSWSMWGWKPWVRPILYLPAWRRTTCLPSHFVTPACLGRGSKAVPAGWVRVGLWGAALVGWPRTTSLPEPLAAVTAGAWAAQAETCEGAASFSAD